MALTHSDLTRDAMANAVRAAITLYCASNRYARIVLHQASIATELATIFIESTTPFGAGTSSTGVITMDASPVPEDSDATGHANAATIFFIERPPQTGTGNSKIVLGVEILRGTVGTSSSDLNMSSTTINNGDAVRINSLTWTAPQ